MREAAEEDGAAAKSGQRTKHYRYGRRVLGMLTEAFGRQGPDALHWWRQLAKQVEAAGEPPPQQRATIEGEQKRLQSIRK